MDTGPFGLWEVEPFPEGAAQGEMSDLPKMAVVAIGVAIVVTLAVVIAAYTDSPNSPTSPRGVHPGESWGEENDYGVGLANAVIFGPVTIAAGTLPVYVRGNVSALSWHRYEGGAENLTGSCFAPTPEVGVCDSFAGVWTPAAWATFASGGAASPLWCYSTGGTGCTNASAFNFTTSDLSSSDGSAWEVVIWNIVPWGLYGFINVTVYTAPLTMPP